MSGGRGRGIFTEAGYGEGSVEVLPDLGDYPMSDGPSVDPRDGAISVAALDEDGGPEAIDGLGTELKRFVLVAGEEAHQELVGRRTMEPPLDVRSYNLVHCAYVTRAQGFIEGEHHPSITGITVFQSFLRVSQF